MLYRILSFIPPLNYFLIASQPWQGGNGKFHLQSQIYTVPLASNTRSGNGLFRAIYLILNIFARARSLLALLQREHALAIVACTGDLVDIPSAFLASRFAHIPFYAYIFDDYVFQWQGNQRRFAQIIAPFIFKHAAGIIAPNEFTRDEYQRRYGVNATMVRNPCDADELNKEPLTIWPADSGVIKIIYTGAIYHANYDCFRNLLSAMEQLVEYRIELHIYTAQMPEQLAEQGIQSKKMSIHPHAPYDEILEQQQKADILFLPLSFESTIAEIIHTSAPGKLGDYLSSGRPILAHVPADSFVAYYCNKHNVAAIASQNNPAVLADEIRRLITDENFRAKIANNALLQSKLDFHPRQESEKLFRLLTGEARSL